MGQIKSRSARLQKVWWHEAKEINQQRIWSLLTGTPNPFASVPPRREVPFGGLPLAPKAMGKKGPSYPLGFSVSSAGTLTARLRQHRNSPKNQMRARTSMLLILGSQRVPTPPSRSSLRGQGGPLGGERRAERVPRGSLSKQVPQGSLREAVERGEPGAPKPLFRHTF